LPVKNHTTYNATLNHLKEFSKGKLTFKQVTKTFVFSFSDYLTRIVEPISVNHYIKRFKIVWNEAVKKGIATHNPFLGFETLKTKQKETIYLELEEIQNLSNIETDDGLIFYVVVFVSSLF
jgi:site-specific recombinase XerD